MFGVSELARFDRCLGRLLPYFGSAGIALTGGIAVEHHLSSAGRPGTRERIADLDFVARHVEGVRPGVAREFLVSHYHRPRAGGKPKALLQLVDAREGLRIDIFPETHDALSRARLATVGGTQLLILNAGSIFEHKLATIRKATPEDPVDPKHARDVRALAELGGYALPALDFPEKPAVMCADVDAACPRCDASRDPDFPLASKRDVFAVLGYV
jgi:hypothetical protein